MQLLFELFFLVFCDFVLFEELLRVPLGLLEILEGCLLILVGCDKLLFKLVYFIAVIIELLFHLLKLVDLVSNCLQSKLIILPYSFHLLYKLLIPFPNNLQIVDQTLIDLTVTSILLLKFVDKRLKV